MKSAIGIGALLEDGIGDTIRVSLTEDPVREVPVARALAARYEARFAKPAAEPRGAAWRSGCGGVRGGRGRHGSALALRGRWTADPFAHERRATRALPLGALALGGGAAGARRARPRPACRRTPRPRRASWPRALARAARGRLRVRCLVDAASAARRRARRRLRRRRSARPASRRPLAAARRPRRRAARGDAAARLVARVDAPRRAPTALAAFARAARRARRALEWSFALAAAARCPRRVDRGARRVGRRRRRRARSSPPRARCRCTRRACSRRASTSSAAATCRSRCATGATRSQPVEAALLPPRRTSARRSATASATSSPSAGSGAPSRALVLAYRILQGARLRTSWTEFISCPSCGRTLFDLEETTARIKARTRPPARRQDRGDGLHRERPRRDGRRRLRLRRLRPRQGEPLRRQGAASSGTSPRRRRPSASSR